MELLTDYPERLVHLRWLYLGPEHQAYRPTGLRLHQAAALLKLEGCDDRDAAEMLRGAIVEVALGDAIPLEEVEYYHYQLLGLSVQTEDGEDLGEIVDVLETPGTNDVYVIHGPRGEILIPAIQDVILDLGLETGCMRIRAVPGLLDDLPD